MNTGIKVPFFLGFIVSIYLVFGCLYISIFETAISVSSQKGSPGLTQHYSQGYSFSLFQFYSSVPPSVYCLHPSPRFSWAYYNQPNFLSLKSSSHFDCCNSSIHPTITSSVSKHHYFILDIIVYQVVFHTHSWSFCPLLYPLYLYS